MKRCKYTLSFPVDSYGRIGGLYTSVDSPIAGYKRLTRDGIIEEHNAEDGMYEVRDVEHNWVQSVHKCDVTNIGDVNDE